jgi:hypothetical protein
VGEEHLVQLAGEHGDAVHAAVLPEPVAGHAEFVAAASHQDGLIEEVPHVDELIQRAGGPADTSKAELSGRPLPVRGQSRIDVGRLQLQVALQAALAAAAAGDQLQERVRRDGSWLIRGRVWDKRRGNR